MCAAISIIECRILWMHGKLHINDAVCEIVSAFVIIIAKPNLKENVVYRQVRINQYFIVITVHNIWEKHITYIIEYFDIFAFKYFYIDIQTVDFATLVWPVSIDLHFWSLNWSLLSAIIKPQICANWHEMLITWELRPKEDSKKINLHPYSFKWPQMTFLL